MPAVSVIMAAYNAERHLAAAVESILGQTFADFELIAVNDGSTDATAALLADYASRDARVKIITQDNAGLAAARNAAIAQSRSDFIAIMDADDRAHPQRLEKQFTFLRENPAYTAVSCRCELVDEQGRTMKAQRPRNAAQASGLPVEELLRRQILVNQTAMIRLSSLGWPGELYRPWFRVLEDLDLSLRIAENHKVAHLNGQPLYQYRQHPAQAANLMSKNPVMFWHYWCAAALSAHCRRTGGDDPINGLSASDAAPQSFLPALAVLPHPIKAACIKNARHWCRRLFKQGTRAGTGDEVERIIGELAALSTGRDDARVFRKVLLGVMFYALRAGRWRMSSRLAGYLPACFRSNP